MEEHIWIIQLAAADIPHPAATPAALVATLVVRPLVGAAAAGLTTAPALANRHRRKAVTMFQPQAAGQDGIGILQPALAANQAQPLAQELVVVLARAHLGLIG